MLVAETFVGGDCRSGSFTATRPTGTGLISATAAYDLRATADTTLEVSYLARSARADFFFLDDSDNVARMTAVCGRVDAR